jgi:hypothetical protein
MIKITLNTLPLDGSLASQINNSKRNDSAEAYVKVLEVFLRGRVCSLHPRMNQEIIVTTELSKNLSVVKNGFCCDRFSESVDLSQVIQ